MRNHLHDCNYLKRRSTSREKKTTTRDLATTMANTFESEPNTSVTNCTCGHNYYVNQRNDDLSQEGDHRHHRSASSGQDEEHDEICSNSTIGTSLPLDTSFVQIPMMRTIPINNNTQHGNLNQMLHHTNKNSISDPAENNKNFDSDQRSNCNLNYTECVTKLYQAVSSTTDSVPSLCQQCVNRYGIFVPNIVLAFKW